MSIRDDAIEAASWAEASRYGRVGVEIAEVVIDAALPVLLAPIRAHANSCATAAHAVGSSDDRRRWLDLLILLDGIERGAL